MWNDPIVLPATWLPLVAGTFIPLGAALLVRAKSAKGYYVAVAAVLSVVLAAAELLVDGEPDTWASLTVALFTAFGAQLVSYVGLWKPAFAINDKIAPTRGLVGTPRVDADAAAVDGLLAHGEPQDSADAAALADRRNKNS